MRSVCLPPEQEVWPTLGFGPEKSGCFLIKLAGQLVICVPTLEACTLCLCENHKTNTCIYIHTVL